MSLRLGVPRWILAAAVVGGVFVLLPLVAMAARVDWADFLTLISSPSSVNALLLSLRTSLIATAGCLVLGVPMAVVLARVPFAGQRVVRAVVLLPLVLPPVVGGLALLALYGRRGLLGGALDVAFSTPAVVIAQTFVALPFLVLSLEGALRSSGERYEAVAATLGARPSTVLFRVTLPLVLPAIVSGAILSFARALGEFGATLTFAGSLQGVTRTLPLEIYLQREADPDAAVALSLVLVAVAVAVVAVAHGAGEGFRPWRGGRDAGLGGAGGRGGRDVGGRDASGRDASGREVGGREVGGRDANRRDAGERALRVRNGGQHTPRGLEAQAGTASRTACDRGPA